MEESKASSFVTTEFPPCCLRIFQDRFVLVGTYELDKPSGNRTGTLDVYDTELNLIASNYCYGAILDLKLSPFDDTLAITGHSTGNIMIWKIIDEIDSKEAIEVELIKNLQVFEKDILVTSLHFSPLDPNLLLLTATSGEAATISIETGDIIFTSAAVDSHYLKMDYKDVEVQGHKESIVEVFPDTLSTSHTLECWTGEFGKLQPLTNVILTGGDDATIIAHDLRSQDMVWSNNRIHEAGVVGIKCSNENFRHSKPTSIITGSYDDNIRSFDFRMLGEESIYPGQNIPVTNLQQLNLGGGVWRFNEVSPNLKIAKDSLMVCCMYNGAKIITIDESNEQFIETNYLKSGHDSMCYGGDCSDSFIATCSFYDKSLQKWNP